MFPSTRSPISYFSSLPYAGDRRTIPLSGWTKFYFYALAVCFALYAILGKGFAYLGIYPVYVGELLLLAGCLTIIRYAPAAKHLLRSSLGRLLLLLILWECVCTIPYIPSHGFDAVRDSVVWLYAIFAISAATLALHSPAIIDAVIAAYRRFCPLFITAGFCCALVWATVPGKLPVWPGTQDVTVPFTKATDLCIHLAGVACFSIVGFAVRTWWYPIILSAFIFGFSVSRGAGVAFLVATALTLLLYPRVRLVLNLGMIFLALAAVALACNISIHMPDRDRTISARQLVENFGSIVGNSSRDDLDGTKEWRMDWWRKIFDYTFNGPYFWTGKGFGVNLALDDGIEPDETMFPGLRSPHNSHLTFLARSGVPGLVLWIILQLCFAWNMIRSFLSARQSSEPRWAALFAWFLAYWLAFIVNAGFDVALEGPVNAIPFWTLWGFGWGSALLFRNRLNASAA